MIYSSSIYNAFSFLFNDYNIGLHTFVHILGTLVIRFISPSLFFYMYLAHFACFDLDVLTKPLVLLDYKQILRHSWFHVLKISFLNNQSHYASSIKQLC